MDALAPPASSEPARAVKAALLLVSTLPAMAGALIAPALPGLTEHLREVEPGVDAALRGRMMLTMPALAIIFTGLLGGWLSDRLGRVRMLSAALVIYAGAGATGLFLDGSAALLAWRLVLGMGVGVIMAGVSSLSADTHHGAARQRFFGLQSAVIALGAMIFLLVGGALATFTWRAPFAVYLAALPMLLVLRHLAHVDGESHGDRRGESARARITVLWPPALFIFVGMLAFYLVPVQVPYRVENDLGLAPWLTGAAISFSTLTSTLVALRYERIHARVGFAGCAGWCMAIIGAGLWMAVAHASWWSVAAGMAFVGVGMGPMIANAMTWAVALVGPAQRGFATGAMTTALFAGQFLSPLIFQPLVVAHGITGAFHAGAVGCVALGVGFGALAKLTPAATGGP